MSSKSEEARTREAQATDDESKATLPPGHPKAGYVSPDGSFSDGAGVLPESEKKWNEQRDQAHEDEVEAVADAEDKAVKEEQERQEKERAAEVERLRKAPPGTLTPQQQAAISAADTEDAQKKPTKASTSS